MQGVDGGLYVKSMSRGGAASESGVVQVGDLLLQVGGKAVLAKSLDKVKRLILGTPGSSCEFLFKRWARSGDSVIYSITLTRRPPAVSAEDGPASSARRSELPSPPSPQPGPPLLALPADGWPLPSASAPSTPEARMGRANKTEGGLGIVFKVGKDGLESSSEKIGNDYCLPRSSGGPKTSTLNPKPRWARTA